MHVVLVGHCSPDAFMLKAMVDRILPGTEVHTINDDEALSNHQAQDSIWLVNRILDGGFSVGESGMELIQKRVQMQPDARVILISDLEEHQHTAELLGAHPGFGKKGLYDESSADRLRSLKDN